MTEQRLDHLLAAARQGDVQAQYVLARLLVDAGETEKALDVARRAAAQGSPEGENLAAWLLATREDPTPQSLDEALELASAARAKKPDSCAIADTLGWVLVKKGSASDALPHLELAAGDCSCALEGRYHLSVAYQALGRHERAAELLQQLLASNAYFEEREEAEALLDRLGRHPAPLPEATAEEYAVYSGVLSEIGGRLIVQRETFSQPACDPDRAVRSTRRILEKTHPPNPPVHGVVESLVHNLASSVRLEPADLQAPDTLILPALEIRSIVREPGAWDRLDERLPNARGIVELSGVGFADDGSQALVEMKVRRPPAGLASSSFFFLEKTQGHWKPVWEVRRVAF